MDNDHKMKTILYFSYGSNMSSRRLMERVPSARFLSIATLKEHRLQFHKISRDGSGKCDAEHTENRNDCVIGVVFEMTDSDKKELDRRECLGFGYEEKTVTVRLENGDQVEASTYCTPQGGIKKNAAETDATLNPYHWYKEHVLRGAKKTIYPMTIFP